MNTDDIFGDMDKQISAINDAVRDDRESVEGVSGEKSSTTLKGKANATKPISIMDKDGKVYRFESKSDCMKFLNASSAAFSRFLKGHSKLNKIYGVL